MQQRSLLITSHYVNQKICELETKSQIKILPKQMASEVLITIEKKIESESSAIQSRKVDLIIIDDNQIFVGSLVNFLKAHAPTLAIDTYYSPKRFLDNLSQYAQGVKICLDNDFRDEINGMELAKKLHELGYSKLYLLSGTDFSAAEVPDYLTVILKSDIDDLHKMIR